MGDYYQIIADLDAQAENAEACIHRVRQWMVAQEIIVPNPTDCTLGEPQGHGPGPNYTLAIKPASPFLFELKTNGVQFISKRIVHYPGGTPITLVCASCSGRFEGKYSWSDAVSEWYKARGPGLLACELCAVQIPITEWQHDPQWAFSDAGLQFWNWPELKPEFINQISKILEHRVRWICGKL